MPKGRSSGFVYSLVLHGNLGDEVGTGVPIKSFG